MQHDCDSRSREMKRRKKQISGVKAMSEALGCSRDHLARGLRGERKMSDKLQRRCEALKALENDLAAKPKSQTK